MKSNLQNLTLMSLLALLVSCGGGSGGSVAPVAVAPGSPTINPQVGIAGAAVKGPITDGSIRVIDANGNEVPIQSGDVSTQPGGGYSIIINSTPDNPVAAPFRVQVTGGMSVCDSNSCPGGVAFGDPLPLDSDFSLNTLLTSVPAGGASVVANLSLATELATQLALKAGDGVTLTAGDVDTATAQVIGLIASITGIDLTGIDLASIPVTDITNVGAGDAATSAGSFALGAFSAAALSLIDGANPDIDTLGEAIAALATELSASVDASGNIALSAATLNRVSQAVSDSLGIVSNSLATAGVSSGDVTAALAQSQALADLAALAVATDPDGVIVIPVIDGGDGGSDNAVNDTKLFVSKVTNILNVVLSVTGAQGFGADGMGATEVFADELESVRIMSSWQATEATHQLIHGICQATNGDNHCQTDNRIIEAGATVTNDATSEDGITFTVTSDANGAISVTDATSTFELDGVGVAIEVTSITHDIGTGNFALTGVEMVTSAEGNVVQTFNGDLGATFADEGDEGLGLKTLDFNGTLEGASADVPNYGVDISFWDITGVTDDANADPMGDYSATFSFTDESDQIAFTFMGEIGSNLQEFAVSANGEMVMGSVDRTVTTGERGDVVTDIDSITDGVVTLTMTLVDSIVQFDPEPEFTVGDTVTATLDENGVVHYDDGSVQLLPGAIF